MDFRQWILVCVVAICVACNPTERAKRGEDAAATANEDQDGKQSVGSASSANGPDGLENGGAGNANAPGTAMGLTDGGVAAPNRSDAGGADAGMARGSSDAAAARPDWEGLVTLDASITTAPDGAVISGVPHYDPAKAGPVLNATAQAACLMLANNICNRSADCQSNLAGLTVARRNQLVASCQDTFLLNHNCNRAISTTAEFAKCAESVKTHDCQRVFADDFSTLCVNQITFQP